MPDFDKIVGGLVWCIEVCNFDIDVDLLFQEDLSIGKKIALTEKIVSVVKQMKCPFAIEPHQIQGLDYIHIFPVIQWLVKKTIETRQSEGDKVRKFAVGQYFKQHEADLENKTSIPQTERKVKRSYRRINGQAKEIEAEVTLMEYGVRKSRQMSNGQAELIEHENNEEQIDTKMIQTVMDLPNLSAAFERYEKQKNEDVLQNDPRALQRAIEITKEQKDALSSRIKATNDEFEIHRPLTEMARKRVDQLVAEVNDLNHESAELETTPEKEELMSKLHKLVVKHEKLKLKEAQFKEECHAEMAELIAENEQLENELKSLQNDKEQEVIAISDEEQKLLEKMTKKLQAVNVQILKMERDIDAVPSRQELTQYQKRFVELDNQIAAEYCETQKFVIMFNALRDQLMFVEKEISLLNSVFDVIPDAKLSSVGSKQAFLNQLRGIHYGVHQSKSKVHQALKEQQLRSDSVNSQLNQLLDYQRQYSLLVHELAEALNKMEN